MYWTKNLIALAVVASLAVATPAAAQDGLLGKKGGGSNSGGQNPPKKQDDKRPEKKPEAKPESKPKGQPDKNEVKPAPRPEQTPQRGAAPGGAPQRGTAQAPPQNRDRDMGRPQTDSRVLLERGSQRATGRSGQSNYGTTSNLAGRDRQSYPQQVRSLPGIPDNSRISREAREDSRVRNASEYRNGYYHYDSRWRDDYYVYPHYRFSYDPRNCVPSPWYFYGHMPAYVLVIRIDLGGGSDHSYRDWRDYRYRGSSYDWWYGSWNRNSLDSAIDDVVMAFERGSARPLADMIPSRSRVRIGIAGRVNYSMPGDDFYDMVSDLIQGTWTRSYRVTHVRTRRDEVEFRAVHEYQDAWGRLERSTHVWRLEESRRGYQVTAFSVEQDRW